MEKLLLHFFTRLGLDKLTEVKCSLKVVGKAEHKERVNLFVKGKKNISLPLPYWNRNHMINQIPSLNLILSIF